MSILERLTGRERKEVLRAPRLSNRAARHTTLDEWTLSGLKRSSPKFREMLERPIEYQGKDGETAVYAPSADIHDDIFLGAHTPGESRTKDLEAMRPSHRWGRNVLDELFKTDAWKDMRVHTEGDELSSAVGTRRMTEVFDESMRDDALREQHEKTQEAAEKEEQLEQILDQLKGARDRAAGAAEEGEPIPQELVDEVKDLTGQREELIAELAQAIDELPPNANGSVPASVGQALEQAAEEGKERAALWSNLQSFAGGALDHATPDEAYDLAEAWMQLPDFKELVKLMGRLVREFRALDAKNVIGGDEDIVGIEQGSNLTAALPSELARLGNPDTQRSFLKDFADDALLQFETQGTEKVELGPGVLCMDMSGSMDTDAKHIQAKAVVVGYVRLMHKKKRDAIVIVFDTQIMWEHHFPKNAPLDMAKVLELASLRPRGGTEILTAVRRAKKHIDSAAAFDRADLLLVTDGVDTYKPEADTIREQFERDGVRSFGIGIPATPANGWVVRFCDHSIGVRQLVDAAPEIVRAVS